MKAIKQIFIILLFNTIYSGYSQINMIAYHPVNEFSLEDLFNLTISYTGTSTFYDYYLIIDIYEYQRGHILTARTGYFDIAQGIININKFNYKSILEPIEINFTATDFLEILQKRGERFPAGIYKIVFNLYANAHDPATGTIIENLARYEYEHSVNLFYGPILVKPYNNDTINQLYPQFIWTPPYPVKTNLLLNYELKIVECYEGQSPYKAIKSNPAFFHIKNINQTLFNYPSYAQNFVDGKNYAWQIFAYDNNILIATSDIWSFTFLESKQIPRLTKDFKIFAIPKRSLDDSYYLLRDNYLNINFKEKYFTNNKLNYKIFTYDKKEIKNLEEYKVNYNNPFFSINCKNLENNKNYILEITDTKGKKWYLRFKKQIKSKNNK